MQTGIKNIIKRHAPGLMGVAREVRGAIAARSYRLSHGDKESFECPLCGYRGPFDDYGAEHGLIENTRCPRCDTFERHRLQWLVFQALASRYDFSSMAILHFAPEPRFSRYFQKSFRVHHTTDIAEDGVDYQADICELPFADASYDVVFASHVLEHVKDDQRALSEIRRVMKPGGFAVLPVPVVVSQTVEYPEANPREFGHVRAVGPDFFERYERRFSKVEVWDSKRFDKKYQLYTYEDRSRYPMPHSPLRTPMSGRQHMDYVPVCYA